MNLKRTSEDVAGRLNRQVARQTDMLAKQAAKQSEMLANQTAILLDRATSLAERADQVQTGLVKRIVPQPRPNPQRTAFLLIAGAGAGYLVAYLLDPAHGRSRRAEIVRRLGGVGREATRTAQRTAVLATDRASGIKNKVMPQPDNPDPDDLTLLDRVESQVFADPSIPKGDINVMVVEGRAVLRGQVAEPQIGAIEAAVRKVVGVKDVENLLHVPGTPAPNKASARSASENGNGSAN